MNPAGAADPVAGPRVLVTRPAAQAAPWTRALRGAGIDAVALPLIGIAAPPSPEAVAAAWRDLPRRRLAVFVSPNAAERFMAARPAGAAWPDGVLAGSPGPGTTRTLRDLGVPAAAIVEPAADAAQLDSEALWAQLAAFDWRGAGVLVVRGDGGRAWLADTLAAHGARVDAVAAYRRVVPGLGDGGRALLDAALAAPARHLWLFASSEAVDNLAAVVAPAADWSDARALATHPRIAERARRRGFGRVVEAQATLAAVTACLQSPAVRGGAA